MRNVHEDACRLIALFTALAILSGCGSGRTLVIEPPEQTAGIVKSVIVERAQHGVPIPEDAEQGFVQNLERRLYEGAGFQRGTELRIRFRFIQFDPGNQFTRWFWGGLGNTGEGSLTIEATYVDQAGTELATIQAQGSINSGFFGGSFELAIDKAAQEIADYTVASFGAAPSRP